MVIQNRKTIQGFTLIELLVVIAIIGVLSSVVLASLNTARLKARTAKSLVELQGINTALQAYYAENGRYPISSGYQGYCSAYGASLGDNWIPELITTGLVRGPLPTDPRQPGGGAPCRDDTQQYIYYSDTLGNNGSRYKLIAHIPESMAVPRNLIDPVRTLHAYGYWTSDCALSC